MIREEKRSMARTQMKEAAKDSEEVELSRQVAAGFSEWIELTWASEEERNQ